MKWQETLLNFDYSGIYNVPHVCISTTFLTCAGRHSDVWDSKGNVVSEQYVGERFCSKVLVGFNQKARYATYYKTQVFNCFS